MSKKPAAGYDGATGYVALLRGINVGGHKPVKMEELKGVFGSLGFAGVKTVLASGNVLFESPASDSTALARRIEEMLAKQLGHEVTVVVRSRREIEELAASDPFAGVALTPQTRLYVTFLAEGGSSRPLRAGKPPSPDFSFVRVTPGEVCSVLTLTPATGTTELMSFLDRELGRASTTRNWNTVLKLLRG